MEADTVVLLVTIVGSVLGSTLATIRLSLSQLAPATNEPVSGPPARAARPQQPPSLKGSALEG